MSNLAYWVQELREANKVAQPITGLQAYRRAARIALAEWAVAKFMQS